MATDEEKRRVAERLRAASGPSLMVLMGVLGVGGAHLFARLADLIDPDCEEGRYEGVRTARAVDLGALRSVASGLRSLGEREVLSAGAAHEVGDEIMEAIGEGDER